MIAGVGGRDGGHTARVGDVVVLVPVVNAEHITHHTDDFQASIWHLLASHPKVPQLSNTWESSR